jgi:hypothetical protein
MPVRSAASQEHEQTRERNSQKLRLRAIPTFESSISAFGCDSCRESGGRKYLSKQPPVGFFRIASGLQESRLLVRRQRYVK